MISSIVKNSLNQNFADFRDLGLILPEAAILVQGFACEHLFYRTPLDECFDFTTVAAFILCSYI